MKIEVRQIYKCEYCNKLYQRKKLCEKHEMGCKKNPDNQRPCFGCENLTKEWKTIYESDAERVCQRKANVLFCKELKKVLHTPKNAANKKLYTLKKGINEPMPKNCKYRTP
jgi:hypothetical protein